jgi:hypothetical protein
VRIGESSGCKGKWKTDILVLVLISEFPERVILPDLVATDQSRIGSAIVVGRFSFGEPEWTPGWPSRFVVQETGAERTPR